MAKPVKFVHYFMVQETPTVRCIAGRSHRMCCWSAPRFPTHMHSVRAGLLHHRWPTHRRRLPQQTCVVTHACGSPKLVAFASNGYSVRLPRTRCSAPSVPPCVLCLPCRSVCQQRYAHTVAFDPRRTTYPNTAASVY